MTIDFEEVLARLDGDLELLLEIYGIFLDKAPGMMAKLVFEVENDCASEKTLYQVHDIKGLASNIGAGELKALAQRYESACREGRGRDEIMLLWGEIEQEFKRVFMAVADYCRLHRRAGENG